ncbi:MAG: nuclease-related domain-containing protein [Caldivirga sp.]|jgi:Holliday junction resolvase-like predicted endonuclease
MVIRKEDALRITEAIFMLTSEFNRVFSLNSLRALVGDYYGDAVNWLIENGLVARVNDRYLRVTVPRLRLLAVAGGELVVKHMNNLSWSEFEEFISFTLNQAGYRTIRGVRFDTSEVRGEFDVIGYRGDVVMVIEAKHWLSISTGELRKIVEKHVGKVEALASNWARFVRKVKLKVGNEVYIYPLVVTLKAPQVQVMDNVPIVASYQLPDFLSGFDMAKGSFLYFKPREMHLS